jgi:hypothetical protein
LTVEGGLSGTYHTDDGQAVKLRQLPLIIQKHRSIMDLLQPLGIQGIMVSKEFDPKGIALPQDLLRFRQIPVTQTFPVLLRNFGNAPVVLRNINLFGGT